MAVDAMDIPVVDLSPTADGGAAGFQKVAREIAAAA